MISDERAPQHKNRDRTVLCKRKIEIQQIACSQNNFNNDRFECQTELLLIKSMNSN